VCVCDHPCEMADDKHPRNSSAFSQRGARANHILCSNDGGQKIRGGTEASSPPALPWLMRLGRRRLGPSGNHNLIGSFFGVYWDFCCCRGAKGTHTPLPGCEGGEEAAQHLQPGESKQEPSSGGAHKEVY